MQLSNYMKAQWSASKPHSAQMNRGDIASRSAATQAIEGRSVWELELDNRPRIVGPRETKMEVKVGPTHSTLPLRRKILYVHIIKEIKLCHPRLK